MTNPAGGQVEVQRTETVRCGVSQSGLNTSPSTNI